MIRKQVAAIWVDAGDRRSITIQFKAIKKHTDLNKNDHYIFEVVRNTIQKHLDMKKRMF